jgi:hypothetical protein
MKRTLLAGLLSAALLYLVPTPAPQLYNSEQRDNTQAVQAEAPRKEIAEVKDINVPDLKEKAPTEQQVVSEPEAVTETKTVAAKPVTPNPSGCEKYRDLIDNYSWNVDVAIAVCNAESSGNANTSNLNDYHSFANCRGSFGLFQINCSHGRVYDPVKNVQIAAAMYEASAWKPWSSTTCRYKVQCH